MSVSSFRGGWFGLAVNVIAKNLGAVLASQVATWSVSITVLVIAPRILGDAAYGRLAFAVVFVGFFEVVANFGTGTYVIKVVAREPEDVGRYAGNAAVLAIVMGGSLAVVAIGLSVILGQDRVTVLLVVAYALGLVLNVVNNAIVAGLHGLQRMARPALWGILRSYAGALLGLPLLLRGGGVVAYAFVFNAVGVIPLLANFVSLRPALRTRWALDVGLWRRILAGGVPFFVSSALVMTYGRADVPMLRAAAGNEVVGWYSLACQWVAMPALFAVSVAQAFLPALSAQAGPVADHFTRNANRAVRLVVFFATPAAIGVALVASPVLSLLYGDEFGEAVVLMQILAIHIPLVGLDIILGTVVVAADRQRQWVLVGVTAALFNPIANLAAIPLARDNLGNAAIGAAITTVLTEGLLLVGLLRLRPAGVLDRPTTRILVRTMLASMTIVPVVAPLGRTPLPVQIAAGVITYAVASLALRAVSIHEIRRWRESLRLRRAGTSVAA